ncbi:MAG TPA: hypothetical protein DIU37_05465, partial [Opitutae bacterium]|nr:hypothetical protein [Opitutae bacterium]
TKEVTPALYAGFILTFVPLYGIQIPIAFLLTLLCRANLPILVGLQLISNPLTVPPIYVADYHVGNFIIQFLGDPPDLPNEVQEVDVEDISDLPAQNGFSHVKKGFRIFGCMVIGGAIIGYFCGLTASTLYQVVAKRMRMRKTLANKPNQRAP